MAAVGSLEAASARVLLAYEVIVAPCTPVPLVAGTSVRNHSELCDKVDV